MQTPLYRILDANLNRSREACRVLDDLCRFVLDDAVLCEAWKHLRHELVTVAASLDAVQLLAARDTEADVGTALTARGEYERANAAAIARSACGRLTEALRSMEEAAKALGLAPASQGFEQLRYRVYTLEKSTLPRFSRPAAPQWRLCVIISESLCRLPWMQVIEESINGGADCIQLREKCLEGRELLARATVARELTRSRGCALVINDRPDIAAASGADGVHLGQSDLPIHAVRQLFGDQLRIGISTSSLAEALAAAAHGADVCGLGPMFHTETKHKPILAGPEYAKAYLANAALNALPHLAIGGITPENAVTLRAAGVRGIAVSSVVCAAADPASICRALIA